MVYPGFSTMAATPKAVGKPRRWRSGRWAPPRSAARRRARSRSAGESPGPGPGAPRCDDGLPMDMDGFSIESWGVIFRMALVKGYRFTWGGGIFRPKPPVFDRSWRSPSKNTVKNSTEDTCSWTRPSKIGKRKVKKTCVFQLLTSIFWFATSFFAVPQVAGPGGGFWVFGPVFGLIFVVLW